MKDKITIYEKPTWTKCREAGRLLRESGVEFEKVNYFAAPLTEEKLRELITKMKIAPRDLLRTGEAVCRELNLKGRDVTDDEIIRVMIEHPELMQRPIVERGHRAVLARPTEKVKEVMSDE